MKLFTPPALWWVASILLMSCNPRNGTLQSGPPVTTTPTKGSGSDSADRPKFGSPNQEHDQHKIDSIRKHGVKKDKQIPPGDPD